MKTCEPATCEFLRRLFVAEESLEISGGDLDEGLKEVSLHTVVPHRVPQSLEDLVTFPPIGKIIEIDSIQIVLRALPSLRRELCWFRLRQTVGMSARIMAWMWGPSRHKAV